MSNHQNNALSLLEVIFTLDSPTYNIINQPFKPLRIIMICNIRFIMELLRLTHAHNNLS